MEPDQQCVYFRQRESCFSEGFTWIPSENEHCPRNALDDIVRKIRGFWVNLGLHIASTVSWAHYLISLSLSFLTCKTEIFPCRISRCIKGSTCEWVWVQSLAENKHSGHSSSYLYLSFLYLLFSECPRKCPLWHCFYSDLRTLRWYCYQNMRL